MVHNINMRLGNRLSVLAMIVILLAALPIVLKADNQRTERLIVLQGFILLAYFDDRYIEIKRLKPNKGRFYGYGMLDKDKVFVAYDLEQQGEATANMEIIDLRQAKTIMLEQIGGVGESHFDVNSLRSQVIYSTGRDLRVISIDTISNEYRMYTVLTKKSCWAEFWIDKDTVGCLEYDDKIEKMVFKKHPIPSLDVLKNTKDIVTIDLKWSVKQKEQ